MHELRLRDVDVGARHRGAGASGRARSCLRLCLALCLLGLFPGRQLASQQVDPSFGLPGRHVRQHAGLVGPAGRGFRALPGEFEFGLGHGDRSSLDVHGIGDGQQGSRSDIHAGVHVQFPQQRARDGVGR